MLNTINNEINLKLCPFCGGIPYIKDHRLVFSVDCSGCGVSMMGERSTELENDEQEKATDWNRLKQTAIDKWNNRTFIMDLNIKNTELIFENCEFSGNNSLAILSNNELDFEEILPLEQIKDSDVFKEFFNRGSVLISDKKNQVIYKLLNWFIKARPHLFKQSHMWRIGPLERYMLAYTSKHEIVLVEFINVGTHQPMFKLLKEDGCFHYPHINQDVVIKEVMTIENFVFLLNNPNLNLNLLINTESFFK